MSNKPATIKEIAKILNLSASSVSRALHDHSSIGLTTRMRVKQLAKELNYVPNQKAIFFQKGKTFTLGVIVPELSESFFSEAVSGIEDYALKKNYSVLIAQSHDDLEKEITLAEKFKSHRVDGLLVSLAKTTFNIDHFKQFEDLNIPIVFFDRIPPVKDIHYVACNMENGTYDAVNFLLKKKHRSIGMINGPETLNASAQRRDGYIQAMVKNRLKFDPSLIINCDLTEQSTREAMDKLLNNKRKPTAIVTFNDYVALYAIKYARFLGIKINDEIDFVSYANLPIIHYMDYYPIASVEQNPYQQGYRASEILLDLLTKKKSENEEKEAYYHITIDPELILH
ncbi:LacI family DNA-binding transcriptional regulator [Pedobacter sp. KR3-3]|uniref:LacI family DNA-binding transcriptional regulator n=1 Tax=Pedobacter albus TaxID=3113905 RepID=A0ABU7I5B9_9SPHI|nr:MULTISPECIES: LacI family DNA-binding transcriptional regulator [unclassified Pedobacter]MEE1944669.1 LacI family DNA-binding transcriptional regulator [Pedobacter sp. KR3-3]